MGTLSPHDPGLDPQVVDLDALLATIRPRPGLRSRLLRRRQVITALCLGVVVVPLAIILGYAAYVRSAYYRVSLESSLSRRLGVVVELGGVRPLGPGGRTFHDIRAQLSPDGPDVFTCRHAVWHHGDTTVNDGYVLDIEDGWVLVGTAGWSRREYEQMLVGGLGHRFDAVGLSQVRLKNIEVRYERDAVRFTASSATGVLLIEPDGTGRASIDCTRLNGVTVDQPVNISARFTTGEHRLPDFHRIRLTVPTMPLSALGLQGLVGRPISSGTFSGTILYTQTDTGDSVTMSGSLRDADLSEWSHRWPGGPYPGRVTVEIDDAVFEGDRLAHLALSGQVYNLSLRAVAPALVAHGRDAMMTIRINQLLLSNGRVDRLSASGRCGDLSLEAITALVGRGTVTGTAAVDVRSMLVVDDELRSADVTVTARPPTDGPAIISREVIAAAAKRWLGVNPAAMLPEHVEYLQLGAHVTLADGRVAVRGTHGSDGRTILTVKLFGQPFGLIREPDHTFEAPDLLTLLRQEAPEVDRDTARHWWELLREPDEQR